MHLAPSCSCGCWGCGPSFRRFFSSKEEKECLEAYKEELKKELAGVENRIREIKGK
ncbi:MAG: hypothetical protein GTO13_23270 [Proteobacteria bacterium]|nr:hypothetical protein [Pseudomonadota bacterium]